MRWKDMRRISGLAAALVLSAIVLGLQICSGAYQADFDSNPDEPAHVVSSLMVHDYLASGSLAHPWEFATSYYVHYPKVAILHWPPLFHLLEAIWMFAAGRTRAGLFSLQGFTGAALAVSVFLWLRREHGFWIAFCSAAVLATTGLVQDATNTVGPYLLLGLLSFWTAALFARYLTTGQVRYAGWSALLGLAALGTHGRGAALWMAPPIALLLVKVTQMRIAAALLVVLAYLSLPKYLGQAHLSSPMSVIQSGGEYAIQFESALRWPVFVLILIGIAVWFRAGGRKNATTVMIAFAISCWIFHSTVNVPIFQDFLITAAPAAIVLAAGGASALLRYLPPGSSWNRPVAMALVALFLWTAGSNIYGMQRKPSWGARRIVTDNQLYRDSQTVWLVAGTPTFEGGLIAETALRDVARQHIVLRASKVLASSSWAGASYRMVFQDRSSVAAFLDQAHVGWVLIQANDGMPHIRQLDETMLSIAPAWRGEALSRQAPDVTIFKRVEPLPGDPKIEIDMRDKLGSVFRLHE